jgi:hypothetical protein
MCPVRNRAASVLWKPPGANRFAVGKPTKAEMDAMGPRTIATSIDTIGMRKF